MEEVLKEELEEAKKEAIREFEMEVIMNMKNAGMSAQEINKIISKYSVEEIEKM